MEDFKGCQWQENTSISNHKKPKSSIRAFLDSIRKYLQIAIELKTGHNYDNDTWHQSIL